jgi:membrane protease subunit HflC
MKKSGIFIAVLVFALVIILANSMFILREDESAIVQRFGAIIGICVREETAQLRSEVAEDVMSLELDRVPTIHAGTGLKFKIPFIDNVIKYSTRIRTDDSLPQPIITSDRKTLSFDNNAQWRVVNPMRFFMRANGSFPRASSIIDEQLFALMRVEVGLILANDLVSNRDLVEAMLQRLTIAVNARARDIGVYVAGINIKRTEVPLENHPAIHQRMNSERERMAAGYRSEGQEEYLRITSNTDRQVTIIMSEAFRDAERLRGEGDSQAARIFNEAHSLDPAFFEFYELLRTYREVLGSQTTLVIPLDSPFARYLIGAEIPAPAVPVVPFNPPMPTPLPAP